MKTATIPPLRVEAALRREIERLLAPNETLSSFVESAIRQSIEQRTAEQEFAARALASRAQAQRTGRYHSAASVLAELKGARRKPARR